jgi:hypothetical protein
MNGVQPYSLIRIDGSSATPSQSPYMAGDACNYSVTLLLRSSNPAQKESGRATLGIHQQPRRENGSLDCVSQNTKRKKRNV